VLLGILNLWTVTDTGKMKFIKKLDYTPLCFCNLDKEKKNFFFLFLPLFITLPDFSLIAGSYVLGWFWGK
jgi:hypothetical protein